MEIYDTWELMPYVHNALRTVIESHSLTEDQKNELRRFVIAEEKHHELTILAERYRALRAQVENSYALLQVAETEIKQDAQLAQALADYQRLRQEAERENEP